MKAWLKKHMPTKKSLQKSREFKALKPYFKKSEFWVFNCESVARGVAAGLAGAVIPGFQLFYAAILAIVFRGNLPVALLATLITNPFTVLPIIYFIHYIGSLLIGDNKNEVGIQNFEWNLASLPELWTNFTAWILQFGEAFFLGVVIVSTSLAIIGYFGTIVVWKTFLFFFRKKKK